MNHANYSWKFRQAKRLENDEELSSAISDVFMTKDLSVVLCINSLHYLINFMKVKA